jgi:hypothetical protein
MSKEGLAIIRQAADIDPKFAAKMGLKSRERGISLDTPIPGNVIISDAWITLPGSNTRVTSVPVGADFIIHCAFSMTNQGGGWWTAGISAKGVGAPSVRNWGNWTSGVFGQTVINDENKEISALGNNVMPAGTGTLEISLKTWMKDGLQTPADMPLDADF